MDCNNCSFDDTSILPSKCQPGLGYQTFVFMTLIEMIIRSKLSIADSCRRVIPPKSPEANEFDDKEYDFVIIGGGPAGSVLGGRLSENPNHKVLLVEAGPEEPIAPSIPMFAFTAQDTKLDWKYETVQQKNACLANGGICVWPRGKMLCGTACMSGMMYTRGSPQIYGEWEASGNKGWMYNDILKYFKKSENNTQPLSSIEPDYHGFSGPLSVSEFPHIPELGHSFLAASKDIGYKVLDVNGRNQTGFFRAPVMIKDGIRASPNRMYIRPALKRKNLRVLLESHVVKIDFDKYGHKATGIQFLDKWNNLRNVTVRKEIIISGGVVGSPQLLLLSGVGPKQHLENFNISVVKDLPVGKNLHVHYGVPLAVKLNGKPESAFTPDAFYEYYSAGTGPFSSTSLTQISAFLESNYTKKNVPDIQIFIDEYTDLCKKYEREHNVSEIALRPTYLISKCRGTIKLRSVDPNEKPLIDPNYLCDDDELSALVEAIRILQRLLNAPSIKKFVIQFDSKEYENCDTLQKNSDCYWRCRIKQYTIAENHHAGTCKMGPTGDPTAVVDSKFRVHGISNLRVVDASIMPSPINCNTIAPVLMFAEKAADLIKNLWK